MSCEWIGNHPYTMWTGGAMVGNLCVSALCITEGTNLRQATLTQIAQGVIIGLTGGHVKTRINMEIYVNILQRLFLVAPLKPAVLLNGTAGLFRERSTQMSTTPLGERLGLAVSHVISYSTLIVVPCTLALLAATVGRRIFGVYGPFCGVVIAGEELVNAAWVCLSSQARGEYAKHVGFGSRFALFGLAGIATTICIKALQGAVQDHF